MKSRLCFFAAYLWMSAITLSLAQDAQLVPYSEDLVFKPGLYLTFENWKNNDPIPMDRIISEYDKTQPDFFERLMKKKHIYFTDENGKEWKVGNEEVFGFSIQNLVFDRNHAQIKLIGSICYYADMWANPLRNFMGDNGGLPNMSVAGLVRKNPLGGNKEEIKQLIIDFETGTTLSFKKKHVEAILQRDPELYRAYRKAKGKAKEKLYRFVFQYNQKHPAFFAQ